MRIRFHSEGGFAGLRLDYEAKTDLLPADVAQRIETLVAEADLFELPLADRAHARAAPDMLGYHLEVEQAGRSRVLDFTDATVPAALRPLLNELRTLAVSAKAAGDTRPARGS